MANKTLKYGLEVENLNKTVREFEKFNNNIDKSKNALKKPIGDKTFDGMKQDLKEATNQTEKFEAAARTLDGGIKVLTGGVGVAAGVMGAFGAENEKVEETLLKVQSAIAFTTGIKDLTEGFAALGVVQQAYNIVIGTTNGLLAATRIALAGLGIGLVIAAITILIANFDKIINVVEDVVNKFGFLKQAYESVRNMFVSLGLAQSRETQKTKENIDAQSDLIEEIEKRYETEIRLAEAAGEDTKQLELEKQREIEKTLGKQLSFYNSLRDEEGELTEDLQKEYDEATDAFEESKLRQKELTIEINQDRIEDEQETQRKIIEEIEKRYDTEIRLANAAGEDTKQLELEKQREIEITLGKQLSFYNSLRDEEGKLTEDLKKEYDKATDAFEESKLRQKELTIEINQDRIEDEIETQRKLRALRQEEVDKLTEITEELIENTNEVTQEGFEKAKEKLIEQADEMSDVEITPTVTINFSSDMFDLDNFVFLTKLDNFVFLLSQTQIIDNFKDTNIQAWDALRNNLVGNLATINNTIRIFKDESTDATDKVIAMKNAFDSFANTISNALGEDSMVFDSIQTGINSIFTTLQENMNAFTSDAATIGEKVAAGLNVASTAVSGIGNVLAANTQQRIQNIEQEEQKRIESLQNQKEMGLITEEELQEGLSKIEKKANKQKRKEEKKAFKQNKAIQITQAVIDTARGVVSGLGAPFPLNIAMPILAGVVGATQIALISKQKFPGDGGGGGISSVPQPNVSMPKTASADFGQAGDTQIEGGLTTFQAGGVSGNFIETDNRQNSGDSGKVSVSENEISNTQEKVRVIEDSATIE